VGVVADVALRAGKVPAAADQPGQVVALVHPPGVRGRAAVAQQQHTGVAVGDRLLLGLRVVDGAVVLQAEVVVGVDQPGHDPALGHRLRASLSLEGDATVHDVHVPGLGVGEHHAPESHRWHAATLSRPLVSGRITGTPNR
jgi:hypothetical protein